MEAAMPVILSYLVGDSCGTISNGLFRDRFGRVAAKLVLIDHDGNKMDGEWTEDDVYNFVSDCISDRSEVPRQCLINKKRGLT
jgi:hypothetical protein